MPNERTISSILEILRRLNTHEFSENSITSGNSIEDVLAEAQFLDARLATNKKRLRGIVERVADFSNGEYNKQLPITEKEDELDVISMSLNTFAEELSNNSISVKAFDDVFNSLISPFFIVDTVRRAVTKFNDATVNFFSYKEKNMYLIHVTELLPADLIYSIEHFTGHKNKTASIQTTFFKDGKERHTIINFSKLSSHYQSNLHVAVFLTDVTARVEKEKLIKQKELAEKSAKMKEEFLANMSHEIRTPMNAIIGLSRLMSKAGSLNEKQTDYLKAINLNSNNLLGLINDILDYAKIEAGKTELERRPFNLKENITALQNSMGHIIKDKGVEFRVNYDEQLPPWVLGDSLRLNQILLNLLSNAKKFTAEGFVDLNVQAVELTKEMVSIRFAVKDSGIGIPEDKQATIFDSFTQASSDTTRKFGGTGLGLAIVKKLVELHGSTIGIHSVVGQGTEFYFIVNYQVAAQVAANMEETAVGSKKALKILLTEDNEFNRMVAIDTLKDWNSLIEIDVAVNGLESVEKVKNFNYDLVLMDIQMPEMDGHTATEVIRKELKSDVPIIAMTAHASSAEVDRCLRNGMNDYIPKPFDTAQLFEKIYSLTKEGARVKPVETAVAHEEQTTAQPSATKEKPKEKAEEQKLLVDFELLYNSANGKQERIEKMVKMFLSDTPREMERMYQFYASEDYDGLRNLAHSLKPKMTYVGLPSLSELAKEIENKSAEKAGLSILKPLIKKFSQQIEPAMEELKKVLNENMP